MVRLGVGRNMVSATSPLPELFEYPYRLVTAAQDSDRICIDTGAVSATRRATRAAHAAARATADRPRE